MTCVIHAIKYNLLYLSIIPIVCVTKLFNLELDIVFIIGQLMRQIGQANTDKTPIGTIGPICYFFLSFHRRTDIGSA